MKLLVGLGNPGEKYAVTRHNLGFMVMDHLLAKMMPVDKTAWQKSQKFSSLSSKKDDLLLVKPQTSMNASGLAVAKIAGFYKIKPEDIWVIYDDLDLALGKIRMKKGGASAGHRGVESIIQSLGTDQFFRFRLGISHPRSKGKLNTNKKKVEQYVLAELSGKDWSEAKKMIKKAVKLIERVLKS